MRSILSQFGHPRGLLGRLVGTVMAYENRERNQWAASLLDAQPSDRILEIGFGPGLAIRYLTQTASVAFVAGKEHVRSRRQAGATRKSTP